MYSRHRPLLFPYKVDDTLTPTSIHGEDLSSLLSFEVTTECGCDVKIAHYQHFQSQFIHKSKLGFSSLLYLLKRDLPMWSWVWVKGEALGPLRWVI